MITVVSWVLFLATVVLDVGGQLLFKRGLGVAEHRVGRHFWAAALTALPVLGGVACYAVEAVLWIALLAREPLSLVFPMASLSYVGVVLASRWLLSEQVSARRWAGVATITIGVVLVTAGGA